MKLPLEKAMELFFNKALNAALKTPEASMEDLGLATLAGAIHAAREDVPEAIEDFPITFVNMHLVEQDGEVCLYWGTEKKILAWTIDTKQMEQLCMWLPARLSVIKDRVAGERKKRFSRGAEMAIMDYKAGAPYRSKSRLGTVALQGYEEKLSELMNPLVLALVHLPERDQLLKAKEMMRSGEHPPGCVKWSLDQLGVKA